jgi:hypothetical protein
LTRFRGADAQQRCKTAKSVFPGEAFDHDLIERVFFDVFVGYGVKPKKSHNRPLGSSLSDGALPEL